VYSWARYIACTRYGPGSSMERKDANASVDSAQISLGDESRSDEAARLGEPRSVFLGVELTWERRISDFSMCTEMAEAWEADFESWDIDGRRVVLESRPNRYRVVLGDGSARFELDGPIGRDLASGHLKACVTDLRARRRKGIRGRIQAQFLIPTEEPFDDLRTRLVQRLFNAEYYENLGEPSDIAYLVDVERGGAVHQVAIGPLRSHEVRRRVAARRLDQIPDRSIFVEVTGYFSDKTQGSEMSFTAHMDSLLHFARTLGKDLAP